ncbi:MAG: aminotransferase class III-fold pyridoxal phosphate-dependent enzyme [Solirubrobacterales bacterium]|nr:aminotransferase class III-fold pyridoxal phosphate-dependent enzyme [Solirubrobacterales bacterium]
MTGGNGDGGAGSGVPPREWVARTRGLLPGGHGRSTFGIAPEIPYAIAGSGPRVRTADGRDLIDLNNNFTTLVHGHAHPDLVAAAQRAVADGACFGLPNLDELRHAEALMERLPDLDRVRYANSGTEAVMTALRVARAHTGRDGVAMLRSAYHGTADPALATGGETTTRGVPRGVLDDVAVLPLEDPDSLVRAVERERHRFAAVLIDFMPNRAGLVPVSDELIAAAERVRADHGVLLIADEVISFRHAYGGLARARGVVPDLMTLGKLIGGGHPVGAVAGRAAVMDELNPLLPHGLEHGGTFSANPVTMAAGRAALDALDAPAIERLNALGERLRGTLSEPAAEHGWRVLGAGSLLRLDPAGGATAELRRRLWWEAVDREVLLVPNGLGALSTPMDEPLVDAVAERLADAVAAVPAPAGSAAAQSA